LAIFNHFQKEKRRYLETCTQCGLCAKGCPIIPYTDLRKAAPQKIQADIFHFMESGVEDEEFNDDSMG
jgi:heterodisulfide reductase subunit C